jgi:hypothetical protein
MRGVGEYLLLCSPLAFADRAHIIITSELNTVSMDEATHRPQQAHSMLPAEAVCQMT